MGLAWFLDSMCRSLGPVDSRNNSRLCSIAPTTSIPQFPSLLDFGAASSRCLGGVNSRFILRFLSGKLTMGTMFSFKLMSSLGLVYSHNGSGFERMDNLRVDQELCCSIR